MSGRICRLSLFTGLLFLVAAHPHGPLPGMAVLDQENGFGGVSFGQSDAQVTGLQHTSSGIGKRWRTTKLFHRQPDTITVGAQAIKPVYWFRNHRFEGVTIDLPTPAQAEKVLAFMKHKYGPSQRDTMAAETEYWLGARTFMLYEPVYPKSHGWVLHISSLAMLNEQVVETAVRRQARATLGWQPDSLGLPRQFPR